MRARSHCRFEHKPHPRRKVKRHPSRLVAGTRFVQKSFLKVEKRLANPANSRSSVFPPLHASLQDQKNNDERDVICLLQVLFTAPVRGTISRPAALQGLSRVVPDRKVHLLPDRVPADQQRKHFGDLQKVRPECQAVWQTVRLRALQHHCRVHRLQMPKVDGKLLCWLCTLSYKRALTKARQAESDRRRAKKRGAEGGGPPSSMSSNSSSAFPTPINTRNTVPLGLSSGNTSARVDRDRGSASDKRDNSNSGSSGSRGGGGGGGSDGLSSLPPLADLGGMGLGPMEMPESSSVPSSVGGGGGGGGSSDRVDGGRNDNGRHSKKPRTDMKGGVPELPEKLVKSSNSGYVDPHSSDHVIAMTQLKETIATLTRKIKQKDSIILEKEKEISAWKGKHLYLEQELMKKYKDMEKNYEFKVDVLNKKLKSQLQEIAQLSKAAKDTAEKKKKPAMFLATTKLHKLKADSGSKEKSSEKSGGRIRIEDDDDDVDDKEDKSNDSDKASEKGSASGSGRNTPKEQPEGKESPRDVDSGKESPRDSDKEDEKEEDEREKSPKKESDSEKEKDDEQSKSNGSAKDGEDEESDKEEEEEKKDDEEKKNEEEEKEDRRSSEPGSPRRSSEPGSPRRSSEPGSPRRSSERGSDKEESDNESDDRSAKGSESDGDDRSAKGSDKDSGSDSGSDSD
ncbi:serine-aspartate repeat-containing protein C isoform X1 [Culex quinquefasciatus]|uniref:serine-aspartate repeat-containing protein C isoform X1 n=1 Tax=Culex quinquefasciatus TaxID=7176 RepID=UPI0018E301DF|nr:serine-aspartate repeat-containing protein C isoform X1 [Culex quinquefasciatus]